MKILELPCGFGGTSYGTVVDLMPWRFSIRAKYREQKEERRKAEEQRKAEEEERAAKFKAEQERRAAKAEFEKRMEQERAAQERLKAILIEERQETLRRNWTNMREAAQHGIGEPLKPPPSVSFMCPSTFGLAKKEGSRNMRVLWGDAQKMVFSLPGV